MQALHPHRLTCRIERKGMLSDTEPAIAQTDTHAYKYCFLCFFAHFAPDGDESATGAVLHGAAACTMRK
jgi:hypothetical protein